MNFNKVASAIQRGTWLIEQRAADSLFAHAENFLNRENVKWFENNKDAEKQLFEALGFTAEGDKFVLKASDRQIANQGIYADAPEGSIAVINIDGPMMMVDYCGSPGTETLSAWVMDAMMSPSIIGVMLKMNTPGGTVEGTNEFYDVVALAASMKPVEVFTNGQLCSAGYWVACPCRITASSGTVEIGSIGTAINYKDYSAGSNVVTHYITADTSPDKNADSREALKGNYTPIKTNIVNPTNEIFMASVKLQRGERLKLTERKDDKGKVIATEPISGQVYLAQPALELGLIDAIGNQQSVLDSIRSRAESEEFSNTQSKYNMSLFGKQFKKLEAIKTKKAEEITEQEIVAVNDEFEAAGYNNVTVISSTHLEEANANADAISNGLTAINTALGAGNEKTNLSEAITALVADRNAQAVAKDDAEKLAKQYGDQPGEKPSKPTSKKESEGQDITQVDEPENKYKTSFDIEIDETED